MPCGRGRDRQDLTPPPPEGGLAPRAGFMGRLAEPPGRAAVHRPRLHLQGMRLGAAISDASLLEFGKESLVGIFNYKYCFLIHPIS